MAHPPRSNPPLRSSSDPPSPCITPSTETFVVIVSFMIVVPFSFSLVPLGRPSWAASHPCYEHLSPDPTPPPGFLSRTFWYAGLRAIRQRDGFGATAPESLDSVTTLSEMHGCAWPLPSRAR